jgi:hypothetical protein
MPRVSLASALLASLVVAGTAARADYIREEGGALTTSLSGVTITPIPAPPGAEEWMVHLDTTVWSSAILPMAITEPPGEPGLVNLITAAGGSLDFTWTSDVLADPGSDTADPSGSSYHWMMQNGQQFDVTFEDLGDQGSIPGPSSAGAADQGSSLALFGTGLLGLVALGGRKFFAS